MTKTSYTVALGEIVIKLNLVVPDKAFTTPIFQGNLSISEEQLKGQTIKELEFELKRIKESE